jgi:hypothetical protein
MASSGTVGSAQWQGSPQRIGRRVVIAAEDFQRFFASDAGRRLRRVLAAGVIVTVPMLFRIPVLRRHPLLRWLELLGGVAVIVKLAEALRDWEPAYPHPIVIDID